MQKSANSISIIIPAKNEKEGIRKLLSGLRDRYQEAEIIVVDDGSADETADIARKSGADIVVSHPYNLGNGAAIKSGARRARGDVLVFMDADGQHSAQDVAVLLERFGEGYDMVVGSRDNAGQASWGRMLANMIYNKLASMISGHRIADLTSGFRVARADRFKRFLYLLPNGFSYPTTITMAFFRAGYAVAYVPLKVRQRIGKSHLRPIHDGIRFLLIIFKIGTLYSPLKIFVPASALLFLTGLGYYVYTYMIMSRFTNMSALLFIASIISFLIGLVSEQITTLIYKDNEDM